jgi:hypothetical protein
MRLLLYRHGVVFPELMLCCSRNKRFEDKIEFDLNFSKTIRVRRSDRTPQVCQVG